MRFMVFSLAITLTIHVGISADLWSLKPVAKPAVPEAGTDWARSELDRFISSKWIELGLTPSQDADALTLFRRLKFNLTGLPPTLEEMASFEEKFALDPDEAFRKEVDRLLSSSRFGEKWARHWLDLARYAESNGKDRDVVFPNAWRYRDYVIEAFNSDKPYDQFVREQVAGDLLEDAGDEQIVATAFLALGPKAFQETDREKFKLDVVDEQIDVLTRSVLGLTVACARCHDHKFDPIPTSDYYALAGIFLSSDTRYGPGPLYISKHTVDTELVPLGERVEELHPATVEWRGGVVQMIEKITGLRSGAYRIQRDVSSALRDRGLKKVEEDPELAAKHKKMMSMRAEADALDEKRVALMGSPPEEMPDYTMAVLHREAAPEDCHIRIGGMPKDRGEKVPRGRLSIPGMPKFDSFDQGESGRLELADWLASVKNPLTARVIVNRVWYHLFGRGLVATVDNFGVMGEAPSHPGLLDFLTTQFVEDGWSVKRLIRRIVSSRTWQLSSEMDSKNTAIDPDNIWLTRANYRRLEVEQFRDSILSVSGRLILTPPAGSYLKDVFPGKDYGVASKNRANVDPQISSDRHRTVYLPIVRNQMPEFLKLFDFADPNAPIGNRDGRNIPAQALYLLNNPFVEEQAAAAAEQILSLPESDRITTAWLLVSGSHPDSEVIAATRAWLEESESESAWADAFQMMFASAQFRFLE